MKTMNLVLLSGNLGKDPEARYLGDGTLVVTLSLAVHSRKKQGDGYIEETDWYSVTVWGAQGEWILATLKSGMGIIVQGRLRQSKWTDTASGQNRIKVEVVADTVYLLPNQRDAVSEGQTESPDQDEPVPSHVTPFPQQPTTARKSSAPPSRPTPRRPVPTPAEHDEDIPF